jgi:hypothetical protein
MQRPEEAVDPGEHRGIILVDGRRIVVGVMPMMECRRGDQPLQVPEPPPHIGMNEEAPRRTQQHHQDGRRGRRAVQRCRQTQQEKREQSAEPVENKVNRVAPGVHQPIHVRGAMVNSVKPPEQRDLVRPSVTPVQPDLGHGQRDENPQNHRKLRERRGHATGNKAMTQPGGKCQRHAHNQHRHDGVQEIIKQVVPPLRTKHLGWTQREPAIQRNENAGEQDKPHQQPGDDQRNIGQVLVDQPECVHAT